MSVINQHQPAPTINANDAIWDLVIQDMKDRDQVGRERYGTPLQGFNGRDALVDAYQEALDLVVYLRQAIWERDYGSEASDLSHAEIQEVEVIKNELTKVEPAPNAAVRPFIMTTADTFI